MKRAITLIAIAAVVVACCCAVFARMPGLAPAFSEKLPFDLVSAVNEKLPHVSDKVQELLSAAEGASGQQPASESDAGQAATSEGDGASTPSSPDGASPEAGTLDTGRGVALVPTDDYASGYVFDYGGETFTAEFNGYSWRIYDSYKITDHGDIVAICQALLDEHPVYGSDWESLRDAEDMAYEWEQHNLAYKWLPEGSYWREEAKDADLDPDDQGKTLAEMYETHTGQTLDIKSLLSEL